MPLGLDHELEIGGFRGEECLGPLALRPLDLARALGGGEPEMGLDDGAEVAQLRHAGRVEIVARDRVDEAERAEGQAVRQGERHARVEAGPRAPVTRGLDANSASARRSGSTSTAPGAPRMVRSQKAPARGSVPPSATPQRALSV